MTVAFALAALLLASCSSKSGYQAGPSQGGAMNTSGGGALPTTAGSSGKANARGGASAAGSSPAGGSISDGAGAATGGSSGNPSARCDDAALVWKSANKTNYESYPDPGSPECIEFNGCTWEGQFAACDGKKPESWVMARNIVAAFPDFQALALHDLCLRKANETIVVTVLDTCADSDCDGCCTENRGDADQLIDLEKYTNQRWGVADGRIEWADLGPTRGGGCD